MKTTHNVPLKALCLTLGVHFKSTLARKFSNIFGILLTYSYLCKHETNKHTGSPRGSPKMLDVQKILNNTETRI